MREKKKNDECHMQKILPLTGHHIRGVVHECHVSLFARIKKITTSGGGGFSAAIMPLMHYLLMEHKNKGQMEKKRQGGIAKGLSESCYQLPRSSRTIGIQTKKKKKKDEHDSVFFLFGQSKQSLDQTCLRQLVSIQGKFGTLPLPLSPYPSPSR